jgi:hypothetical protein
MELICVPWITHCAAEFLSNILNSNSVVFEWGSGSSTWYYSVTAEKVTSVEHDANWHTKVSKILSDKKLTNVDYRLVIPEVAASSGNTVTSDDSDGYVSSDIHSNGMTYHGYCSEIDRTDGLFDFIAIDGRARPSCLKHAIPKLVDGGWLMFDNSERIHYKKSMGMLSEWERKDFQGTGPYIADVWTTSFWQKSTKGIS